MLDMYDDRAWSRALAALVPSIHPVDQTATRIWFHFFPLRLARALATAGDPQALAARLQLRGRYWLRDQIDTSHRFLYGHRYWPEIKKVTAERSARGDQLPDPEAEARAIAAAAAARLRVPEPLVLGIAAVALMTLQQAGLEAFEAAPGEVRLGAPLRNRTPEEVLALRARDDRQPWLRKFIRGDMRKYWTVSYDEHNPECRFRAIHSQHITTAAAADPRPLHTYDPRCKPGEGPIPVECRIAACGNCWVGILAGAEKVSEVTPLEQTRIRRFGYIHTDEPKPLIRLACMTQVFGAVSLVIPPWNAYFDNYLDPAERTA